MLSFNAERFDEKEMVMNFLNVRACAPVIFLFICSFIFWIERIKLKQ